MSLVGTNPDPEDGQTQYDELLPEAVDHMVAAFMHKASLGYERIFVIGELYAKRMLPEAMGRLILERDESFLRKDPYGNLSPNTDRVSGIIDSPVSTTTGVVPSHAVKP